MGNPSQRLNIGLWTGICLLAGIFLIMMLITSFVATAIGTLNIDERAKLLIVSGMQAILLFMTSAIVFARIYSSNPFKQLGLTRNINFRILFGIIIFYIIATPFINQLVYWNNELHLPESLSSFEESMRSMEEEAGRITAILLSTTNVWGMIAGIAVIGILTGIGEEMFFRGALQRFFMHSYIGPVISIWISAFIFSFMHFQFFGFFPRLLLGAWFGYLLWWTGSLHASIIAHVLNNSVVVLGSWLVEKNIITVDTLEAGVVKSGFPTPFIISFILIILFIIWGRKFFFRPIGTGEKERNSLIAE